MLIRLKLKLNLIPIFCCRMTRSYAISIPCQHNTRSERTYYTTSLYTHKYTPHGAHTSHTHTDTDNVPCWNNCASFQNAPNVCVLCVSMILFNEMRNVSSQRTVPTQQTYHRRYSFEIRTTLTRDYNVIICSLTKKYSSPAVFFIQYFHEWSVVTDQRDRKRERERERDGFSTPLFMVLEGVRYTTPCGHTAHKHMKWTQF